MAEVTVADLESCKRMYSSSRALWDVFAGQDAARPIIEAVSSDDITVLQTILSEPQWTRILFEKPYCIIWEDRARKGDNDVRRVAAAPRLNIERIVMEAAVKGHVVAVSMLLDFASQQGVDPSDIISCQTIDRTIRNGHGSVIKALAAADPSVISKSVNGRGTPLDLAVRWSRTEIVEALLELGADVCPSASPEHRTGSFGRSLLSRSIRDNNDTRITELLLAHGVPVAGSGALHLAAQRGWIAPMNLLIQHEADVNEQLLAKDLTDHDRDKYNGWTPMHFAAHESHVDAFKLLERNGAQSNVQDAKGFTPAQLFATHQ